MTPPPKPPRPGVTVYSKSIRYADGGGFPVGGIVVDTWPHTDEETGETRTKIKAAGIHFGHVQYHILDVDDIDPDAYNGEVAVKPCRDLAARMSEEQARHKHWNHLGALLAISNAVETRGVVLP